MFLQKFVQVLRGKARRGEGRGQCGSSTQNSASMFYRSFNIYSSMGDKGFLHKHILYKICQLPAHIQFSVRAGKGSRKYFVSHITNCDHFLAFALQKMYDGKLHWLQIAYTCSFWQCTEKMRTFCFSFYSVFGTNIIKRDDFISRYQCLLRLKSPQNSAIRSAKTVGQNAECFVTLFFYKNLFYKNMKLKNAQNLRACWEHNWGWGKAKNFCFGWLHKIMEIYFFSH